MLESIRRSLFLALLFALPAEAGPLSWVKRQLQDHPTRTRIITTAVTSAIYAEGLHRCRLGGVENCQAHYGAAWGTYGATVGLNLIGQLVGQKIGGKTGNAIAYGGSTAMLGWGAWEWHGGLNKPKENHETHVDLSRVVLLPRH